MIFLQSCALSLCFGDEQRKDERVVQGHQAVDEDESSMCFGPVEQLLSRCCAMALIPIQIFGCTGTKALGSPGDVRITELFPSVFYRPSEGNCGAYAFFILAL